MAGLKYINHSRFSKTILRHVVFIVYTPYISLILKHIFIFFCVVFFIFLFYFFEKIFCYTFSNFFFTIFDADELEWETWPCGEGKNPTCLSDHFKNQKDLVLYFSNIVKYKRIFFELFHKNKKTIIRVILILIV